METRAIEKEQTHEWLLNKHYAKRLPSIIRYCFGLYDDGVVVGVCVFGLGNRMFNDGAALFEDLRVETVELQRLVVNEGLPENTLSQFVSQALGLLPWPMCVYSYADGNQGHHGYIYQATNWIYTGMSNPRRTFLDTRDGRMIHERTLSGIYGTSSEKELPDYIKIDKEPEGKHRYVYFVGDKRQVKEMRRKFKYDVLPYPKGENRRYDASYRVSVAKQLF